MIKKAFTLAEVMIVLVVIGVLTGILVPAAFHSMPNENVMKFKKAHNTLYRVINELVNDDKYYKDGDLGIKPDGTPNGVLIDGTHTGDYTYFCNSIADIVSAKSVDCKETSAVSQGYGFIFFNSVSLGLDSLEKSKAQTDIFCKQTTNNVEIITTDNVSFFQTSTRATFGMNTQDALETIAHINPIVPQEVEKGYRWFVHPWHVDDAGNVVTYKLYCIDIDGVPSEGSSNCDDDKDICPFGYGIRYDGKILTGARADEWLQKSIQDKD